MFPVDDPTSPPLIGPSTLVVVNDARHQLQPEFLQRTTPYFFDVDTITGQYKWAKVKLITRSDLGQINHDSDHSLLYILILYTAAPTQETMCYDFHPLQYGVLIISMMMHVLRACDMSYCR